MAPVFLPLRNGGGAEPKWLVVVGCVLVALSSACLLWLILESLWSWLRSLWNRPSTAVLWYRPRYAEPLRPEEPGSTEVVTRLADELPDARDR